MYYFDYLDLDLFFYAFYLLETKSQQTQMSRVKGQVNYIKKKDKIVSFTEASFDYDFLRLWRLQSSGYFVYIVALIYKINK